MFSTTSPLTRRPSTRTTYLIAELEFDTMADVQRAFASHEGQATAADLGNFAQAGVTILAFDTRGV